MNKIRLIALLSIGILTGCDNGPKASTSTTTKPVNATTTDAAKPNAKGVEVHAPGVDVEVGKDRTHVKAPATEVDTKKD